MNKVVVLKKTSEKHFFESEIIISELDLKIICIFVPFKHKLKRKDREKLLKVLSKYYEVFTNEPDLFQFECGAVNKNWFAYFLIEGINYIIKSGYTGKIAVENINFCELLKDTVLELGERYRVVEIYTSDEEKVNEFARFVYDSVGLPLQIKNCRGCEAEWIVRINNDITVYNAGLDAEYTDLEIEYLYPLSKYVDLPLEKILKSGLERGKYKDIIHRGMVKIVGGISK